MKHLRLNSIKKFLPTIIVLILFSLVVSLTYAVSPQNLEQVTKDVSSTPAVQLTPVVTQIQPTIVFPQPKIKVTQSKQKNTPVINATPTLVQDKVIPTAHQTANNSQPTSIPTLTPTPVIPTSNVHVEIKTPDSPASFSVELKDGMNVCDVLQKAKDEGKITSVTFDDSYLASFQSKYVYEINGYKNNWSFTVNGTSPLGCSLSHPKPNDSIVWKFL